jgi:urease accessory protein
MDPSRLLTLMQLCDSALPIGTAAHSFGLETLVAEEMLTVDELPAFLHDLVSEAGALEGAFCREAHRLAAKCTGASRGPLPADPVSFAPDWIDLNRRLGAFKPARESRAASATLGRRVLRLAADVSGEPLLREALEVARTAGTEVHQSAAFGLVGSALGWEEEATVLAYLQQSVTGLVSACQRLLPLGQAQATRLLWDLKPALVAAARRSRERRPGSDGPSCFTPLLEIASMRHPGLTTRLFIS